MTQWNPPADVRRVAETAELAVGTIFWWEPQHCNSESNLNYFKNKVVAQDKHTTTYTWFNSNENKWANEVNPINQLSCISNIHCFVLK